LVEGGAGEIFLCINIWLEEVKALGSEIGSYKAD